MNEEEYERRLDWNAAGDVVGLVGAAMDVAGGHVAFLLPNDLDLAALRKELEPYFAAMERVRARPDSES